MIEKVMPHNLDAEEAVLGSILLAGDGSTMNKVMNMINKEDFYRDKNQWIYQTCCLLYERDEAINQITVSHELDRCDRLEAIGGPAYLSNLIMGVPTAVHAEHYAEIVKNTSQQRQLILAGQAIAELGYITDPEDAFSEALAKILKLKQDGQRDGPRPMAQIADDNYTTMSEWVNSGFAMEGISSGFTDLDRAIGGLKGGQLIIIASRPSMGKTQLLLQIARNCSAKGYNSLFFSLEMTSRDLLKRLVCAEAKIDAQTIRAQKQLAIDGMMSEIEAKWWDAYSKISKLPMWIDDSVSLKINKAKARMLSLIASDEVDLMAFDHISLAGDTGENEVQRLGIISQGLKAIAKITNKPVIVASQLSRELRHRADKRPHLDDLRSSGELEQNADVVLGLYRDEYYYPQGHEQHDESRRNMMEVLILKQRDGAANPVGGLKIPLYFDPTTGFMGNWHRRDYGGV